MAVMPLFTYTVNKSERFKYSFELFKLIHSSRATVHVARNKFTL